MMVKTYPDVEIEVLVGDGFHVETYRRYCGDDLANLCHAISYAALSCAEELDGNFTLSL